MTRIDITPPNTFTLLSTGPNQVAQDNPNGNNGLFTKYLVQQMKRPGLDLGDMVIATRRQVMAVLIACYGGDHQHGGAKPPVLAVVRPAPSQSTTRDPREPEMMLTKGGTFMMGSPASDIR